MKRLIDYINEERIDDKNVVLWQNIEVPQDGYSEEWAKSAVEEMLPELEKKIIAAIILGTENKNAKDLETYELNVRQAAELAGPQYKKFLKLDDEGKKQWIEDKIADIKQKSETDKRIAMKWSNWPCPSKGTTANPIIWKPTLKNADEHIDINGRSVRVHNNITHQNSCIELKFSTNYKQFAQEIVGEFPKYPDNCMDHLKNIYVYTASKNLFDLQIIHITFGFDDEFENQLSKSVSSFADRMHQEYSSGRYMGD